MDYAYETEAKGRQLTGTLDRQTLAQLPPGPAAEILAVVESGDKNRLDALIAGLVSHCLAAADLLQRLADDFAYDTLTALCHGHDAEPA